MRRVRELYVFKVTRVYDLAFISPIIENILNAV